MKALVSALSVILVGCATPHEFYVTDDGRAATDAEFQRSLAACRAQSSMRPIQPTNNQRSAYDSGGAMMNFGGALQGIAMGEVFIANCLRSQGWVKADEASARSIPVNSAVSPAPSSPALVRENPFFSRKFDNE